MKGKLLNKTICNNLSEDTKVILVYRDEEILAEIKHSNFTNIKGNLCRVENNLAFKFLKESLDDSSWATDFEGRAIYEYIEEDIIEDTYYKGWQILKMIDEGKLEEGTKLEDESSSEFIVKLDTEGLYLGWKGIGHPSSIALQFRKFKIIKEYMSFDDARRKAQKNGPYNSFKHKDMPEFYNIYGVLGWLKDHRNLDYINQMLDEKLWEVRYDNL